MTPATRSQRHKVDLSFNQYENCLRSNNRKEGNLHKLQRNKKETFYGAQHWCVGSDHAWWLWGNRSPAWPSTSPPSRSSPKIISRLPGTHCHWRFFWNQLFLWQKCWVFTKSQCFDIKCDLHQNWGSTFIGPHRIFNQFSLAPISLQSVEPLHHNWGQWELVKRPVRTNESASPILVQL